jgi:hypothetical protein
VIYSGAENCLTNRRFHGIAVRPALNLSRVRITDNFGSVLERAFANHRDANGATGTFSNEDGPLPW